MATLIGDSLIAALEAITPANSGVRGDQPSAKHLARVIASTLLPQVAGIAVGKFTADGGLMTVGTGDAVAGSYVNEPELLGTPIFVLLNNRSDGVTYIWHTGMADATALRVGAALVAANAITVRENEFDIGTAAINVNTQVISYIVIFRR